MKPNHPILCLLHKKIHQPSLTKGLILLGKREAPWKHPSLLHSVMTQLATPVLADIGSFSRHIIPSSLHVDFYPYLLQKSHPKPSWILHLGGTFVSNAVYQYLKTSRPKTYIHVHPENQPLDPSATVTHRLYMDTEIFLLPTPKPLFYHIQLPSQTETILFYMALLLETNYPINSIQ